MEPKKIAFGTPKAQTVEPVLAPPVMHTASLPISSSANVPALAATPVHSVPIKRLTLEEVNSFGAAAMQKLGSVNEELLKKTKASSLDEAGSGLSQLLVAAQAYDPKNLGKTKGLIWKAKLTFQQLRSNFDSVHTQMQQLTAKVDGTVSNLHRQITDLEKMYEGAKANYRELDAEIDRLDRRIQEEEAYPPQFDDTDPFSATEKQKWQTLIAHAKQHLGNMRLQKEFASQMGVMINMSAQNAAGLIQDFGTVKTFTIPSMKNTFVLMTEQLYQKQAVQLKASIREANSKAIRTNAKMFGENTKAIADEMARAVIEIDDLEFSNQTIIQAISDVKNAQDTMVKRIASDLPRLESLSQQLRAAQTA